MAETPNPQPLSVDDIQRLPNDWQSGYIGPGNATLEHVECKPERWFWMKRIAYWLGLRKRPACWDITYEFRILP